MKHLLFALMMAFAINTMGQVPTNWFIDTPEPDDISLSPNTEFFTEGTTSCEMTLHTTNVPYLISENYTVNMGASYTFSIDVLDNDTRGVLKIYAEFYDADGNDIWGEEPVYSEDNPDWQTITWSAVVPDGAVEGYVWIKFYDDEAFVDEAIAYVDNAIFMEDGAANAVANGGFENWAAFGIENAYCINDDAVDVRYNAAVESVDPADFMLSGTADITFSNAEIDMDMPSLVHLSGASEPINFDLTIDMLAQEGLEGNSSVDLYGGIAPIAYTNSANPDGVLENGISATFHGMVSANDAYNNFWVHDAAGEYNGVMGFSYSFIEEVAVGDEVLFTGKRDEYYDLNEIVDPVIIEIVSTGNVPYAPAVIMGSEIDTTLPANDPMAEKWEGQLVEIHNALVTEVASDSTFYKCTDDDGATYFKIGDNVDYQLAHTMLEVGQVYSITGVVDFSYGVYRLNPRGADDIVNTTGIAESVNISYRVFPNPTSDVLNISADEMITNVRISDINGALVSESKVLENQASIDVSSLAPGMYFVNIRTSAGSKTSRIVIR